MSEQSYVYFVHSYYLKAGEEEIVKASTEYGVHIHASVEKGNVFPEGKLHEDVYVSHLFVQRAGRVAITGEKLYLYRTRTGSIKKSPVTEERVDQNLDAQRARLAFFEKEGMHGSCRRLKWGFGLHVMMYRWRLLRQQLCK